MIAMKDDCGFTLEEWFEEVRKFFLSLAYNLNRNPDITPSYVRNQVARIYGSNLGDHPSVHTMCRRMFDGVNIVEYTKNLFPPVLFAEIEIQMNPFTGLIPIQKKQQDKH